MRAWILALACSVVTLAQAAQQGTIQLLEPAGVATTTQDIDVRVRITLAADAQPVIYELPAPLYQPVWSSPLPLPVFGGINPALPQDIPFASYGGAGVMAALPTCNASLSDLCAPTSPYTFELGFPAGLGFGERFELQPGQGMDFTLGVLHPRSGLVPAGAYSWNQFKFVIYVSGLGASGFLINSAIADFGSTCASLEASCAFTRQVVEVPEPGSPGLLTLGLLAVGAARRWSWGRAGPG